MCQQDYGRAEVRAAPQYSSPKSFSRSGCPSAVVIAELRCAIAKRNVDRPIGYGSLLRLHLCQEGQYSLAEYRQ
jgi:hypothetical protein